MANWRCKKLTQNARNHACQYCHMDDGTIVAAHSNKLIHGKGMGLKAHDCFIAYLCHSCHDIVDGRKHSQLEQHMRDFIWTTAHQKTLKLPSVQKMLNKTARCLLSASAS